MNASVGGGEGQARERAQQVRAMFSAIAPSYDRLNRLLSFGIDESWRRRLVRRLPDGPVRVLDLACGTGDVAVAATRARGQSRVFAADFALPMLKQAVPKLSRAAVSERVLLQNASAEDLPYRDEAFDAATMAFGIRNVIRRERALREIRRVLRPGGLALILDFSLPVHAPVRAAYGLYFHRVLPFVGGILSGRFDAYRYLPRSVEGFPSRSEFAALVQSAGFAEVDFEDLTMGVATLYRARRP